MPRIRKADCDSFDEVCKILNDFSQRIGTLAGQKSAEKVKALQEKVAVMELNQRSLQTQIDAMKTPPEDKRTQTRRQK